jgi:hypothetical protein
MANGAVRDSGTREERLSLVGLVAVLLFTDASVLMVLSSYGVI